MRKTGILSVVSVIFMVLVMSTAAFAALTTNTGIRQAPTIKPISPVVIPNITPSDDDSDDDGSVDDSGSDGLVNPREPGEIPDYVHGYDDGADGGSDIVVAGSTTEGKVTVRKPVTNVAAPGTCISEPNFNIQLNCPDVDTLSMEWPQRPYDFSKGDCAITDNESEVLAYIEELQALMESCYGSIPHNLEGFEADKKDILDYLNDVPAYDPNCEIEAANEEGGEGQAGMSGMMEPSMPMFSGCIDNMEKAEGIFDEEGFAFTNLLMHMEEAVNETCAASYVLNEDLVCSCDDVAGYINPQRWLWPNHKKYVISEIEHSDRTLEETQRIAQITVDWFMYMKNSWEVYYDPDHIAVCGALSPKEMMSPAMIRALRDVNLELVNASDEDVLETFSIAVRETYDSVEELSIGEEGFSMKLNRKAKVLGFIPAKYMMAVDASDEKVTEVSKPWWLFVATDDAKDTVSAIDEELSMRMQIQMERRSKIIETLSNIMKKIETTEETVSQNIK